MLVWKYFIICFALLAFIQIPTVDVRAASVSPWHCGYGYDEEDEYGNIIIPADPPMGVKANVYTILPSIPWYRHLFQWVSVVISYSPYPGYWIQLGYYKTFQIINWQVFFVEKQDADGWAQ